jgi:hypothetical protein
MEKNAMAKGLTGSDNLEAVSMLMEERNNDE